MGSSKSGNLDQMAQFSLPAALASGKVKLPETGAIGAIQGQAEDNKVAKERAMNQMNQQVPSYMMPEESNQQLYPQLNYNLTGLQPAAQSSGAQQMNYLRQHLPYADGGHVALRRKMFKLGGDVNTHGVGITSGLAYNTGGRVGLAPGGIPTSKKDLIFGLPVALAKKLWKWVKGKPTGKKPPLSRITTPGGTTVKRPPIPYSGWNRAGQAWRGAGAATGILAGPGAVSSLFGDRLSDFASTEEDWKGSGTERVLKALRHATEAGLDFSLPGYGFEIGDYLTRDPTEKGGYGGLSDFLAGRDRGPVSGEAIFKKSETGGQSDKEIDYKADKRERDRQRMQDIYEDYLSLMDRQDQPETLAGKFFGNPELGDALISGGSALMQGEGWGPSAEAFNAPLTEARQQREGEEAGWKQMAASQAISDISAEDQATQAALAEHLGTGDFDLAEATQKYQWAKKQDPRIAMIPTDEKGELDQDAIKDIQIAGGGVFMDVTNVSGTGKVFIAIKTAKEMLPTNDLEEAQKYVAS